MLKRSRIGTGIDTQRLGQALARPGMDPRVWLTLAYANDESIVDSTEGVFVDVTLSPSGQVVCARVPATYAGNLFGRYAKIHKDDELLVGIPNGDPAEGVIVVARLWSSADKPPDDATANPDEVMDVVEVDKSYRLRTSGAGKVEIDSENTVTVKCDKVRLGEEAATEQLVLGTTYRQNETSCDSSLETQFAQIATSFATISAAMLAYNTAMQAASQGILLPPAGYAVGIATAAMTTAVMGACATGQAAALAAQAAITTFESSAPSYLSNVSKTK